MVSIVVMKLAIVGVSKIYTDDEERDIRQMIACWIKIADPDLHVSKVVQQ